MALAQGFVGLTSFKDQNNLSQTSRNLVVLFASLRAGIGLHGYDELWARQRCD
jgi:hypothetical protein